jgi:hypothetical protein
MKIISQWWQTIQGSLFSFLEEELDPLTKKQQQLVSALEILRIEDNMQCYYGYRGRPKKNRLAIARAFVAKALYNMPTTRMLLDRLQCDINLRRICGWETKNLIPNESTFSRAFEEFSFTQFPMKIHDTLIKVVYEEKIIGHVLRDSTAIIGREKSTRTLYNKKKKSKYKKGRPKKGELRPEKEASRIEKQKDMTLEEMIIDLPKTCDVGAKKNSKGYIETWTGYKLHIDSADGDIPISCILTSASTHDSQVAIPLATLSNTKVINLYDLMDAAYDVQDIRDHSKSLNHVPIIDINPGRNHQLKEELLQEEKRQKFLNWKLPEKIRYNNRSSAERVNSRLKDEFGARSVRVRGPEKVLCHLMFGVLALTVDQLIRFIQ